MTEIPADELAIWREFKTLGWAVTWHEGSGTFEAKRIREGGSICGKAHSLGEIRDSLREIETLSSNYENPNAPR